jgi:hypothetical protein
MFKLRFGPEGARRRLQLRGRIRQQVLNYREFQPNAGQRQYSITQPKTAITQLLC